LCVSETEEAVEERRSSRLGAVLRGVSFLDSTGVARETPHIHLRHEEIQTLSDLYTFLVLISTLMVFLSSYPCLIDSYSINGFVSAADVTFSRMRGGETLRVKNLKQEDVSKVEIGLLSSRSVEEAKRRH
jgi:hypothetical protein